MTVAVVVEQVVAMVDVDIVVPELRPAVDAELWEVHPVQMMYH